MLLEKGYNVDNKIKAMDLMEEAIESKNPKVQLELLEKAKNLDPDNLDIYSSWALVNYDDFKAYELIKEATDKYYSKNCEEIKEQGYYDIDNRPYFRSLKLLMEFYIKELLYKKAEDIGNAILRDNSNDNLGARYKMMSIYTNSYQYKKAIEFFNKNENYEEDEQMLVYMITVLVFDGNESYAQQLLEKLVSISPDICEFFLAEDFERFRILSNYPNQYYSPRSKGSLAIPLSEISYLLDKSRYLYNFFRNSLMEINPRYFRIRGYTKLLQKSEIFKDISDTVVLRLFEKKLMTLEDFKNVTEKEVLTLDCIGPVTIKKLKDNGIKFKED